MGFSFFFWLAGVAVLFFTEWRLYRRLAQNLAPGVRREDDVWFGIPGRGGRLAISIDSGLFNETGKKYRRLTILNEAIYALWIFGAGPFLIILARS
jgi:hypothetical protein